MLDGIDYRKALIWLIVLLFPITKIARAATVRITVETLKQADRDGAVPPSYEVLRGKMYGELDPTDRHNSLIQDILLAPRNARGKVEYVATFTLYRPAGNAKQSGLMIYEVVNRGSSLLPRDYSQGDIFLQSGWQGDIPFGGKGPSGREAETILVPTAHNAAGTPVTGPVLARFADIRPGTNTLPIRAAVGYSSSGLPPQPVSLATNQASLTTRTYEDTHGTFGGVNTIPNTDWAWANCTQKPFPGEPDPTKICMQKGFRSDLLYQLQYTGKDPLVLGIGLAAIRDISSFFHNETAASNPLAGQIHHVIGRGLSQSGNLIRTFLNLGFNEDEAGRRVWDAIMPIIAARQTPMNFRFAIPGGASNLYEPGSDGTVWWPHWSDAVRGNPPSGLLDRCEQSKTCPKVMEVMGSSEFYALRASPDFVGTSGMEDIPLPPLVRRYYIASTQHGGGPGGFHWRPAPIHERGQSTQNPIAAEPCLLPPNPNPMTDILRALFVRLRSWVMTGQEPPLSKYPQRADGTLVPETEIAKQFPFLPAVPSPENIANPTLIYDFGPRFQRNDLSGIITNQPPPVVGVLPTFLPSLDADGNESGGIHTVQQQAPLGTYLGWNVVASGFFKGRFCSLTGSYVPFADTKKKRLESHDPRLSLEERYGTHEGYVNRVRLAADALVQQGFLLPGDASRLVLEAGASDVLRSKN